MNNTKPLGNKEALHVAQQAYGPYAFAKRIGKFCYVGVNKMEGKRFHLDRVFGKGKSYAEALTNAAIWIRPARVNVANVPMPADVARLAGGGE